ncbi:MAG TPA: aminomethyl-transferring glycine dehydrogenase subunit GcvPA [Fimbriimonadaceae bacterium]|nr:aminomethyl-transferring glycine dehydrogenase subunit GcvPA [Fimbriimonadaceae bacterium]
MPYIPHTEEDRKEMLETIGVKSIDELFREIPDNLRLKGELNIPSALDEHRLLAKLSSLGRMNKQMLNDAVCFLGAGIYDRYVPSTVNAIISRGEFLTAYTPYQPELSQGYLQAIYEFQSMVSELYGMDVANASMYDGATAMAEAAILAHGVNGKKKVVVSGAVHPHYREVLNTYCWSTSLDVDTIPAPEGATEDYSKVDAETSSVIVQYPNFFGTIEDLAVARDAARKVGATFIVVADPIACAILPPPGEFDADIVVGEGQPMGISMGFGGPLCGLFSCKESLVRRIPGRIVGRTKEAHGEHWGYVMTLRTREQDIRREKATSNICTNEALMALCATVYMEALGKNGMQVIARDTVQNTQYAIKKLTAAGARLRFSGKVFGEFVLELPADPREVQTKLLNQKILAGLPLGFYYPELKDCLLVAVTETRTKEQIDDFAAKLADAIR